MPAVFVFTEDVLLCGAYNNDTPVQTPTTREFLEGEMVLTTGVICADEDTLGFSIWEGFTKWRTGQTVTFPLVPRAVLRLVRYIPVQDRSGLIDKVYGG